MQAGAYALSTSGISRVVIVQDPNAINSFQAQIPVVQSMVDRGITNFTGQPTVAAAWRHLVSTQDIVGIKVFSAGGEISGTRPAVVAAVIHGLQEAGLPSRHIIVWDRRADDLRSAGFFKLARLLNVRAEGAAETGYDPTNYYLPDSAVVGNLVYGDLEFGKKGEGVGRKSFVTKILSRQVTKIISISPLLNQPTVAAAWRHLVSTQDIVGIKVFSAGGEISGTRPAVVAAVIHGLEEAGLPSRHIIVWDRRADDLRTAGFFKLARLLNVRAEGAAETGYDPTNYYLPDSAVIGNLVYGDLEFGKKGEGVGRKSFVTKILSRQVTKIISISPLLNQPTAGVCGHLYSLAFGSVDNTLRFQNNPDRLSVAVPEINALPSVGDRVVLNITDALIGQYEGGASVLLQYSTVLDQLWFSADPVALDTMAIRELDRERQAIGAAGFNPDMDIYKNAVLLQLGTNDPSKIRVVNVK